MRNAKAKPGRAAFTRWAKASTLLLLAGGCYFGIVIFVGPFNHSGGAIQHSGGAIQHIALQPLSKPGPTPGDGRSDTRAAAITDEDLARMYATAPPQSTGSAGAGLAGLALEAWQGML